MDREWIEIVVPSKQHAERLVAAIGDDFEAELWSDGGHSVRVTPDTETAAKLVTLFNAVGQWLSDCGLGSCDIRFGERSLTIMPATAEKLGDPTAFLIERTRQLEQALRSRIVIEQAKGMLAERSGIGVEEAFELLRRAARNGGRKLHDVAAEVVSGELDPRPNV
jgi:hypothetical protein